jgi:hypothetical protein
VALCPLRARSLLALCTSTVVAVRACPFAAYCLPLGYLRLVRPPQSFAAQPKIHRQKTGRTQRTPSDAFLGHSNFRDGQPRSAPHQSPILASDKSCHSNTLGPAPPRAVAGSFFASSCVLPFRWDERESVHSSRPDEYPLAHAPLQGYSCASRQQPLRLVQSKPVPSFESR